LLGAGELGGTLNFVIPCSGLRTQKFLPEHHKLFYFIGKTTGCRAKKHKLMYITYRSLLVRNLALAIANGSITLIILLIAPLGLAAVILNTVHITGQCEVFL
jgi:hypothetical protein